MMIVTNRSVWQEIDAPCHASDNRCAKTADPCAARETCARDIDNAVSVQPLPAMVKPEPQPGVHNLYCADQALLHGTLYPELWKPMANRCQTREGGCGVTREQAMEFTMWELRLYLDTHPCDEDALRLLEEVMEQFAFDEEPETVRIAGHACEKTCTAACAQEKAPVCKQPCAAACAQEKTPVCEQTRTADCGNARSDRLCAAWLAGPWPWEENGCGNDAQRGGKTHVCV